MKIFQNRIKVGGNMLIMSMNDLREYRLRYGITATDIARRMKGEDGKSVSRQFIGQLELGSGRTNYASEKTKLSYLKALYEAVQEKNDKKEQDTAQDK